MTTATLPIFLVLLAFGHCGKDKPVFSDEIKEIIQTVHDACVANTGVSEAKTDRFYSHLLYQQCFEIQCLVFTHIKESLFYLPPEDITNCENGIFKEDTKLKCYMFCLLEESSLADEDGNVDYDMLVSLIPEEYYDRTSKMIFGCKHLDTPDKEKCQRAFDVHKCSYEKDPDLYFLF